MNNIRTQQRVGKIQEGSRPLDTLWTSSRPTRDDGKTTLHWAMLIVHCKLTVIRLLHNLECLRIASLRVTALTRPLRDRPRLRVTPGRALSRFAREGIT